MPAWFYLGNQGQTGPIDESDVYALIGKEISPETMVWKEGMSAWQPFSTIILPPPPVPALSMLSSPLVAENRLSLKVAIEPKKQETPVVQSSVLQPCKECKHEFAQHLMEPFGPDWICRPCRFKMIQDAKNRGQRQAENAFDGGDFVKKLGFIALCLGVGSALFAYRLPQYEELLKYNKYNRRAMAKKHAAAMQSSVDLPTIFLPAEGIASNLSFLSNCRFFLVEIGGEFFAYTVVPGEVPADLDLAKTNLQLKSWESYADVAQISGLTRRPVEHLAVESKCTILLGRVTTRRTQLSYPPAPIAPGIVPATGTFTILSLAEDKSTSSVETGASTGVISPPKLHPDAPEVNLYMGVVKGILENKTIGSMLVGAPCFTDEGELIAFILDTTSEDTVTLLYLEKAETLVAMAAELKP